MKDESKKFLTEYNASKGWGVSDKDLIETLTEGKDVWEGGQDRHRWYSMIPTVVQIGDRFFNYDRCDVHGEEGDVDDCIGGYKLDMFTEVAPVEVKKIEYQPQ